MPRGGQNGVPRSSAGSNAVGLVLVHVVFNVVKLVGYDETEVFTLLAADAVILGLLMTGRTLPDRG